MPDYAHIFTPSDLSLEERIRAYREVAFAHHCAEESLYHVHNDEWLDTLGSEEEIDQAFDVISRSLSMAIGTFDATDLIEAVDQGLLSKKEASEIVSHQRKAESEARQEDQYEAGDEDEDDDQDSMR